jgi:hypothetical protein
MSRSLSVILRFSPVMATMAMALAMTTGKVEAQTATQLVAGIRNFDWENSATMAAVPKQLSQAGLYANIGNKATRAFSDTSVVPFQVNSALWSDGTHKERFISLLPGTKVVPTDTSLFTFPDGAVLIKNFWIDTVYGDKSGNSRILIETRFLVYQVDASGSRWSGLSYSWRRNQTDADLIDPETGLNFTHNVKLNGVLVGKRWRYPSTGDCAQCHKGNEKTMRGTLGFITPQLNRLINGTNQLQTLVARGILSANPVAGKPAAHRWYGLTDTATLEQRTLSYLASNCSHCHGNTVGHGQAVHNMDYMTATKRIVYQKPPPDVFDDPTGAWVGQPTKAGGDQAYIVLPGYPDSSAIMAKMKHRSDFDLFGVDVAQMPPFATAQPDSAAVNMIEQWICSLKAGTPCGKIAWDPDETFWDTAVVVAPVRPRANLKSLSFQPSIQRGQLSVPSHLAALGVRLLDYRGREIKLVQEGEGRFRLASSLTRGVYFLVAGPNRIAVNYNP